MKKQIIFEADPDSIIFKDSEREDTFYCMTQDFLIEKMKITEQFGRREINVPDEYTIKVSPILKVESKDFYTDIYKPKKDELIDFPINKIEWIWIRI